MIVKKPVAFAIAALLLFSSSVPVYASNVKKLELTMDEERLFEKIFARLESHSSMMPVQVDDVKKSLSESRKFFFACTPFNNRVVESVSINVRTKFVPFDRTLAEKHKPDIYVADYTWDCETFKDNYTITIECVNRLMLNPDFMIKEETETDGRRSIAMAENEMYLYHELLHGQLMIDAMNYKSSDSDWKKESCSFFANNKNDLCACT